MLSCELGKFRLFATNVLFSIVQNSLITMRYPFIFYPSDYHTLSLYVLLMSIFISGA